MDLNATRIFINIVQQGSFSAAARHMKMPVATVSRQLSELEKSLNIKLLERTTRKLRLTLAGETLYQYP